MAASEATARRYALIFLIGRYRTQTELARVLSHETLTQPILSSIERRKRPLHPHEARDIERIIGIPEGWMSKEHWVRDGWKLITEYQSLGEGEKSVANRMVSFALEH
jgi:SOS response regulatory protein OraA/RecX